MSYSGVLDAAVVSDEAGAFELVLHDEEFAAAPAIRVHLTDEDGNQRAAVLRNAGGRIEASFELGDVVGVELEGASPEARAWVDANAWAEREWNEWFAAREDVAAHLAQWKRVAAKIAAEDDEYRRGLLLAAQFRIGRGDPELGLDRSEAARAALDTLGLDDPRWAELDGGRLCTAELRGNLTVIEFWSTWCQGCRKAAPLLREANAALADDQDALQFVSIDVYEDPDSIRGFLADEPMPWRHGWVIESEREAVRSRLQLGSVPTLLLVDADGIIVASSPELRAENLVTEVRALGSGD